MTTWVIYLERDGNTELMLSRNKQVLAVAGDELRKELTEIQQFCNGVGVRAFAVMRDLIEYVPMRNWMDDDK